MGKYKLLDTDVFIVSYPRSGNTWLRLLISDVLLQMQGYETSTKLPIHQDQIIPELYIHDLNSIKIKLAENARFIKTHSVKLMSMYSSIYIYRKPEDALTSYFHYFERYDTNDGKLKDGIDTFCIKHIREWVKHINSAIAHKNKNPDKIYLISYEDMHTNTVQVLFKLLEIIGINATFEECEIAVHNHKFAKHSSSEKLGNVYNEKFFRKGVIGGGLSELQNNTIKILNTKSQEIYDTLNKLNFRASG